jgi:uncharacterized SAM-binding protein YcdF (DUF218 family)
MRLFLTLGVAVLGIAAIILGISFYLQPNSFVGCDAEPTGVGNCQKADAIIALSGGDTTTRTEAAIQLYKHGWADVLIFSGAAQDKSGPSNAAVMQQQAIAEGVPGNVILLDEEAVDTAQNAQDSESIFQTHHLHSVILVTSGYHQRRAYLEFQQIAKDVIIYNAPTNDKDWDTWWWARPRGWWLAGGELVKIALFYVDGAHS